MSVEDLAITFSGNEGRRALEFLKQALGYDNSAPERAAELATGEAVPYCPNRHMFRAGMREAIIVIETCIEAGLKQIDERSSDGP